MTMSIAMKLREILDIQPGTLIKGLHVSLSGSIRLSLDGWEFDQRKLVRGLWSSWDREQFTFQYYNDVRVGSLIDSKLLLLHSNSNMSLKTFQQNGKAFYKDINKWTKQERIDSGDCLGMSLGENFIAVKPSHADIYRPDYYEVYLFHKVLHNGTIKWIVLQSRTISKTLIVPNPKTALSDIIMELT